MPDDAASPTPRPARLGIDELQALISEGVPLAGHLDCRVVALDYGSATLRLPWSPLIVRPGGTIGGPAMMTLVDVAIWGAVLSMIGPVALAVTTDLTFHFLRKPPSGTLEAEARTLQLGRRLAVAECTIRGLDDPRPLLHAVGTYALPEAAG